MFQGCEAGFFLMEGFLQPCIQTCAWNFLLVNIQFGKVGLLPEFAYHPKAKITDEFKPGMGVWE
jgi:hypothetical protein